MQMCDNSNGMKVEYKYEMGKTTPLFVKVIKLMTIFLSEKWGRRTPFILGTYYRANRDKRSVCLCV